MVKRNAQLPVAPTSRSVGGARQKHTTGCSLRRAARGYGLEAGATC